MAISILTWNLINQAFIFMITAAMTYKCAQMNFKKTATHATLCTIGFVFLCAEGLMVRYDGNLFTRGYSASTKTTIHLWLQVIGGLLGIVGTLQKSVKKERHFHTWHGKFGIAACVFFFINCLSGFMGLYSSSYRYYVSPMMNDFIHNCLGLITFLTGMIAQYLGYSTGFFMRNFSEHKYFYRILTIVVTILTMWGPYQLLKYKYF